KTKNIIACCKKLVELHGGEVPRTLEELVPLPGIGRKTANVVLGTAFAVPGITVDTHVGRLSRRLRLTPFNDPAKLHPDLMRLISRKQWSDFSLRMIFLGRHVCRARKPRCGACVLARSCPKIGVKVNAECGMRNAESKTFLHSAFRIPHSAL